MSLGEDIETTSAYLRATMAFLLSFFLKLTFFLAQGGWWAPRLKTTRDNFSLLESYHGILADFLFKVNFFSGTWWVGGHLNSRTSTKRRIQINLHTW